MRATLKQELRAVLRDPVPPETPWEMAKPYVVVVTSVAAATAARVILNEVGSGTTAAYLFYWVSVFVSAWFSARAGVIAALASAVLGSYLFIPPENEFVVNRSATLNGLIFFVEAAAVSLFISGLRSTIRVRSDREKQLHLFSEVGRTLARRDGYDESLQLAADLAVGSFADICAIDLVTPEGDVKRATVSMLPTFSDAVRDVIWHAKVDRESPTHPVAAVLRTGEPFFIQEIGDLIKLARTQEHRAVLTEIQVASSMALPLADRRHLWGAITFARTAHSPRYSYADFLFGQELAARISSHLERMQLLDELAQANRAKDDFLGVLSHEMRSPITVITGGVDLILNSESPVTEEQRYQMMRTVRAEAERLGTLFDNLLTLATGTDITPLALEPINVTRFLREFVPVLGERLGESRIQLDIGGPLPLVEVVPTYLEQILRNLLTNAQKYSPAGSPIHVAACLTDEGPVEITVADRGPGVPEEELERIFTPYYRTADGKRKAAGFGVGLGVARQLAGLMGGTLHAELPAEGGLKVILRLPPMPLQPED